MKKAIEQEIETLARQMIQDYFVRRDNDELLHYLTPEVSWFGTGVNEVCSNLQEAVCYLNQESDIYTGEFNITEEWYHTNMITEDCACVMAQLTVSTDPKSGYFLSLPLRFSAVLHREKAQWKVCHIHNSVAYHDQGNEEFFDQKAAKAEHSRLANLAKSLAEEQILNARLEDPLTGIPNLEGFLQKARLILQENPQENFAVFRFGINNFRLVNQKNGYEMGDRVLRNIAHNLRRNCGAMETCARIEKDDFVMLMVFHSEEETDVRMDHLDHTLLDMALREKLQMRIVLTGGFYLLKPNEQIELREAADKAMITVRNVRRDDTHSRYEYFNEFEYNQRLLEANILEEARDAMQRGEFKMYIQPQVDIKTMNVCAGEVLCRWIKADGTVIMPNDFIPLFEQTGLIKEFDFYMLEQVCAQIRKWIDSGIMINGLSINQSRLHVKDADYIERFCRVVDKYDVPHECLSFELTESTFVEESGDMCRLAQVLEEQKFRLEIDDFGSGYASLNLINILSADVLKIDRSLLPRAGGENNERSIKVLEKVIELAHETGMTVVCEGVETQRQAELLQKLECDIAQGFYFYYPMSARAFETEILRMQRS